VQTHRRLTFTAVAVAAFFSGSTLTFAQGAEADGNKPLSERLNNLGLIHRDDKAPVLQEFWLLGRYHGQYHDTETSTGEDSGWEDRRARFGFQARMFEKLTLHVQAISGPDFDPNYNGFSELWVRWSFSDALQLTIGQQKHRFTHDRNVSSRYLNYMERSMFTNMMALDYTPAITLSGRKGKLEYYTGVFTNATSRDIQDAFTANNSGVSFIAGTTYDLGTFLGADTAYFYGSYVHSDPKPNATNLTRFDDAVSGALILTKGSGSLVTELTSGLGGANDDANGLNIQPSYYLTDRLQLVGRYQIASSSRPTGLSSQRRYERAAGLPAGDSYRATYLGLNYYLANHRLKFMVGYENAEMDSRNARTGFAGFRMYFGPHSNAPFPGNKMLKGRW
jgi:phosphate-selective porin OprO and OprP